MKKWMKRVCAGVLSAVMLLGQADGRAVALAAEEAEDWEEVWATDGEDSEEAFFGIDEVAQDMEEQESEESAQDEEAVPEEEPEESDVESDTEEITEEEEEESVEEEPVEEELYEADSPASEAVSEEAAESSEAGDAEVSEADAAIEESVEEETESEEELTEEADPDEGKEAVVSEEAGQLGAVVAYRISATILPGSTNIPLENYQNIKMVTSIKSDDGFYYKGLKETSAVQDSKGWYAVFYDDLEAFVTYNYNVYAKGEVRNPDGKIRAVASPKRESTYLRPSAFGGNKEELTLYPTNYYFYGSVISSASGTDAKVYAYNGDTLVKTATVDSSGEYELSFSESEAKNITKLVAKDSMYDTSVSTSGISFSEYGDYKADITLTAGKVTGSVAAMGDSGKKLSGATIYVDGEEKGVTDQNGAYTLSISRGTHILYAKYKGLKSQEKSVNVGEASTADFDIQTSFTITGSVAKKGGSTIQGMPGISIAKGQTEGVEISSHSNGTFNIDRLEPGEYTISADFEDRAGSWYGEKTITITNKGIVGEVIELELQKAATYKVSGYVRDENGNRISGAKVVIMDDSEDVVAGPITTNSSASTDYTFTGIVGGHYAAVADYNGLKGYKEFDINGADASGVDITIDTTVTLSGKIFYPGGQTAAGAAVSIGAKQLAQSNPDGSYSIELVPGSYTVGANVKKDNELYSAEAAVELTNENKSLDITLSKHSFTVSGSVKDQDGKALSGITVVLDDGAASAVTGGAGTFSFTLTKTGTHKVTAKYDTGDAEKSFSLEGKDVSGLEFVLKTVFSVSGVVKKSGAPVYKAKVKLGSMQAETDSDGEYLLSGIAAGSHSAEAEYTDKYGTWTAKKDISVKSDISDANLELSLTAPNKGTISGTVTGSDGAGLAAEIYLLNADTGEAVKKENAMQSGSFSLTDVPYGSYIAAALTTGENPLIGYQEIELMQAAVSGVQIKVQTAFAISGTVRKNGSPVSGADIMVNGIKRATTDASGRYSTTLIMGSYTISAVYKQGGQTWKASKNVSLSDEETVDLDLSVTSYTLSGTVRGSSNEALAATVSLKGPASKSIQTTDGSFSFTVDTDGEYVISAQTASGLSGSKAVTLSGANVSGIKISIQTVFGISGKVLKNGSAQSGVTVSLSGHGSTRSASDGSYSFSGLSPGDYTLNATSTDKYGVWTGSLKVSISYAGKVNQDISLALTKQATYTVSGTAKDSESNPVADAEVELYNENGDQVGDAVVTDETGMFAFKNVVISGHYAVSAQTSTGLGGYEEVDVDGADVQNIELYVQNIFAVGGKVYVEGEPVEGAEIIVNGLVRKTTKSDGYYETAVMEGRHIFGARYEKDGQIWSQSGSVVVNRHILDYDFTNMELEKYKVSGTVADSAGEPLAATVSIADGTGKKAAGDIKSTDGKFTFTVDRSTSYKITATSADGRSGIVNAKVGGKDVSGLAVVLPKAQQVSGKVFDRQGNALKGVSVRLLDSNGSAISGKAKTTDADGSFTIEDVVDGSYLLQAQSGKEGAATISISLDGKALSGMNIYLPGNESYSLVKKYSYGSGFISLMEVMQSGAPSILPASMNASWIESNMTEAEKKAAKAGRDFSIVMYVSPLSANSLSAKEKDAMLEAAKISGTGAKLYAYMDISLEKQLMGKSDSKITKLPGKALSMMLNVPSKAKPKSGITRTYSILRLHDGKASVLRSTKSTVALFESGYFSTFALAYHDTVKSSKRRSTGSSDAGSSSGSSSSAVSQGSSTSGSGGGGGGGGGAVVSVKAGKGLKKAYYIKVGKKKAIYISPALSFKAKRAIVPAKVKIGKKKRRVISVADYSFTGYEDMQLVIINKKVKKIGNKAFYGCKKSLKVVRELPVESSTQ